MKPYRLTVTVSVLNCEQVFVTPSATHGNMSHVTPSPLHMRIVFCVCYVFPSLKLRAGLVSFIFGKALDNLCEEKKKSMISI